MRTNNIRLENQMKKAEILKLMEFERGKIHSITKSITALHRERSASINKIIEMQTQIDLLEHKELNNAQR